MSKKKNIENKEKWTNPENCPAPTFPIFHIELPAPYDFMIKDNVEQVIGDIDFYGWEWNDNERFIDSHGRIYKCKFDKWFLTIPYGIERTLNLNEVKEWCFQFLMRS